MSSISVGAGHLEIEHGFHRCGESGDVVVLYVPAVFAKVGGDAVGARSFTDDGALHGIRTIPRGVLGGSSRCGRC